MTAETVIPDGEALLTAIVVVVRVLCNRQRAANRRGGCSKNQVIRAVEAMNIGIDVVSIEALLCELIVRGRIHCTNQCFWV